MSAVPLVPAEARPRPAGAAVVPFTRRPAPEPPPEKFLAEPVPLANYDRAIRAGVARASRGIAWPSLMAAWADWYRHLASAPGKQMELASKAQRKAAKFALYALESLQGEAEPCIEPLPQDRRFTDPAWQQPPFNLIHQSFLLWQQWIWNATNRVAGVSRHHERMVTFTARQMLDILSPTNFLPTNPEVLARTIETGGMNLAQGAHDWWRDVLANFAGKPAADGGSFRPGHEVAVTPGKVVLRNDLIELIQYTPATETVYARPVLIVPSPILKYYILDLSPGNSMVRYLVENGHTVFVLSWRNPDARDRELGVDHYLRLGIRAAIDAVAAICGQPLHTVGYCLGGTFLAMLAASMAGAGDDRIASLTLLAAEVDFTEAGELSIFIDDSQLVYLEDMTWEQGYLDGKQMSGAFTLLNSNDLLWSRLVRQYLMAEPPKQTDLSAWNVDTTRLPHRMHTEYLRKLYLNNDLASGRYRYDGRALALSDIRAPIFLVGTERDHVAPWKSVYMLHLYADADITFCLTSGGHNVGIVNPPQLEGGPARHYLIATKAAADRYVDPDQWFARHEPREGSWWPAWQAWLAERSGERGTPPPMGNKDFAPIGAAPGSYVLMR